MSSLRCLAALAYALLLTAGCGGGGGDQAAPSLPAVVVTFKVQNAANLPVHGLQFSAYLPPGVTVPLEAGSHTVAATNLVAGSALSGLQMQVFGTYSAPIRKLKLVVMPLDKAALLAGFSQGEIVQLSCGKTAGSALSVADFMNANNGTVITDLIAYRYVGSQQVEEVSQSLTPSLSVTLN